MKRGSNKFTSTFLHQSLSRHEKNLISGFSRVPFPFLLIDQKSIIHYVNPSFVEITGYRSDELIGKSFNSLLEKSKIKKFSGFVRNVVSKGGSIDNELIRLLSVRGILHLSFHIRKFIIVQDIEIISLFGIETPQPEKPLENRKFLKGIEDTGEFGYWELDESRNTFYASSKALSLLGLNKREGNMPFKVVLNLIRTKEDRENLVNFLNSVRNREGKSYFDFKVSIKGKTRALRLSAGFGKEEDIKYSGIVSDITEIRKLEKQLVKFKNKKEKEDRIKSFFLTKLSYEIRTPMNAILGFTELLNSPDITKEQRKEYSMIVRHKSHYLLSLIDDVLELSNFESGSISIDKTEFKPYPLLQELSNEYKNKITQIGKPNIQMTVNVDEENRNKPAYTDVGRLYQVFSNLLNHSIKYTERGEIEISYKYSEKNIKFQIADTGLYLNENDKEPYTSDSFSSKKRTGTDIGLAISKLIIELLGGKMKIHSDVDTSTRFQINIPVGVPEKKKDVMVEERNEKKPGLWKDKVILIAEDDEVNFRFLELVLQKTQAKILRAKNGFEAVDLCRNIKKIDIILMDIKMPGMDGYEATTEINKFRPELPIIAQTAFASHEELMKCRDAGCRDYITKPIDIELLIHKVNSYF